MNARQNDNQTEAPRRLRVLLTWGSKLGGTEGIARIIAEVLAREGFDVVARPASEVRHARDFDAAIVGGALYANRWHREARRFVARHVRELRRIPVWLFSSGPLDESADTTNIPPVTQVAVLMERIGACGHTTFGGRLARDAQGFPAAAMAKNHSGDWRNPDRIRAWAGNIAQDLPWARPHLALDPPARSLSRLVGYGIAGWALCAMTMAGLLRLAPHAAATALHAIFAPLIFVLLAARYFRARGAREPLSTALVWTAFVAVLDASVIAGALLREFTMLWSFAGTWLPLALIFSATWATGLLISTQPWPKPGTGPSLRSHRDRSDAGAGGSERFAR